MGLLLLLILKTVKPNINGNIGSRASNSCAAVYQDGPTCVFGVCLRREARIINEKRSNLLLPRRG